MRISEVEEVRALVLKMVGLERRTSSSIVNLLFWKIEQDEICATISADDTVTFSDPPAQFSKTEIDQVLAEAQNQATLFAILNREVGKSKEFLTKVWVAARVF